MSEINKTYYMTEIDGFWRSSSATYRSWAESHGISFHEFLILYRLGREKSVTQKNISQTYGLPKQSVSYVAKRLEEKGLVKSLVSNTDRREKDMVPTAAGRKFIKKAVEPVLAVEENVFEELGAERVSQAIETLELIYRLMDSKIKKNKKT